MNKRTHVLAIAVEQYADQAWPTASFAERDARNFVAAWQNAGVPTAQCVTLFSEQASSDAIHQLVRQAVRQLGAEDHLILLMIAHGFNLSRQSYFAAYDADHDRAQRSALPVSLLVEELQKCSAAQLTIFLDAHRQASVEGWLPKASGPMQCAELVSFCQAGSNRALFAPCCPDERSHVSSKLKESLWMHALVNAIGGEEQAAREDKLTVTCGSLQSYILAEMPRLLRTMTASHDEQTPQLWAHKDCKEPIVRFVDPKHQQEFDFDIVRTVIQGSSLTGQAVGRVRELSGYVKPKNALSTHNDWEQAFVAKAGQAEVTNQANEIAAQLREAFRYKRKDFDFSNVESVATIRVPDFDVHISLTQDPEDASRYVLSTEVTAFRNPEVIDNPSFVYIFSKYCNRVIIDMAEDMDLESKIDAIEEFDELRDLLKYDQDCTQFELSFPNSRLVIRATKRRMTFSLGGHGDLKTLLEHSVKAIQQLATTRLFPGLPDQ